MSTASALAAYLRSSQSWVATWTPDRRLAVGDVLVVHDDQVSQVGHIDSWLVREAVPPLMVREVPGALRVEASEGVTFGGGVSASGKVGGVGGGSLLGRFSGQRSFLLVADVVGREMFADLLKVEDAVRALDEAGAWRPEWLLVTEVVKASALTVVVARGSGVEVSLAASAAEGVVGPAGVRAGAGLAVASGQADHWEVNGPCTPGYHAFRWRRRRRASVLEAAAGMTPAEELVVDVGEPGKDRSRLVEVGPQDVGLAGG